MRTVKCEWEVPFLFSMVEQQYIDSIIFIVHIAVSEGILIVIDLSENMFVQVAFVLNTKVLLLEIVLAQFSKAKLSIP